MFGPLNSEATTPLWRIRCGGDNSPTDSADDPTSLYRPRTVNTTDVLISLKFGFKPCPCAPTSRNISPPSVCRRGASSFLGFFILPFLLLLLSGKSGGAWG